MKKIYLFLFFVMFIFLTSCRNKTLNESEMKELRTIINEMDESQNSEFYFLNETGEKFAADGRIVEDGFTLELHTDSSDPFNYYFFHYKDSNVYAYTSYDESELKEKEENLEFKNLDEFSRYIIRKNYGDVIIASYSDLVPFVKDAFNTVDIINKGRRRQESEYKKAYYYSVEVKEELLINSACYSSFKEFIYLKSFKESKDDMIEVSIIVSFEDKKVDNRISISINDIPFIALN